MRNGKEIGSLGIPRCIRNLRVRLIHENVTEIVPNDVECNVFEVGLHYPGQPVSVLTYARECGDVPLSPFYLEWSTPITPGIPDTADVSDAVPVRSLVFDDSAHGYNVEGYFPIEEEPNPNRCSFKRRGEGVVDYRKCEVCESTIFNIYISFRYEDFPLGDDMDDVDLFGDLIIGGVCLECNNEMEICRNDG